MRIFLAEKGVSIPCAEVDLAKLEHKTPEFSGLNPFETIPILELDDGTRIAETINMPLHRGAMAGADDAHSRRCTRQENIR